MDGDLAPLPEIVSVAADYGAMTMVDEAHATGVFGPGGSGLIRQYGLEDKVNVSMGTLSKALGGYGGFIACSPAVRELLVNRARAFIYTTGLPPSAVGSAIGALAVIERAGNPGDRLLGRAAVFRRRLQEAGLNVLNSQSQIIPVLIGENGRALASGGKTKIQGHTRCGHPPADRARGDSAPQAFADARPQRRGSGMGGQRNCRGVQMKKCPVLLISGWAHGEEALRPVAEAMAGCGPIVSLSLASCQHAMTGRKTSSPYVRTVSSHLDKLGEPACLVGWSTGGVVAIETAARYPEKVACLVLLSATARFCSAEGYIRE